MGPFDNFLHRSQTNMSGIASANGATDTNIHSRSSMTCSSKKYLTPPAPPFGDCEKQRRVQAIIDDSEQHRLKTVAQDTGSREERAKRTAAKLTQGLDSGLS